MVQLGLSLPDIATALDLEEGLIYLGRKTRPREVPRARGQTGEQ